MASITIYSTQDTYVAASATANNYSTDNKLKVGSLGAPLNYMTLIQFSLSGIPAGSTILTATLAFYQSTVQDASLGININYHRVTSSWTDSTVTYATLPTYNASAIASSGNYTTAMQLTFNLKDEVQWLLNNPSSNFGALIRRDTIDGNPGSGKEFYSYEAHMTYEPYLAITYNPPDTTPPTIGSTGGPQYISGNTTTVWAYNVTDNIGISYVSVYAVRPDQSYYLLGNATKNGATNDYYWSITDCTIDGQWRYDFRAYDAAGNAANGGNYVPAYVFRDSVRPNDCNPQTSNLTGTSVTFTWDKFVDTAPSSGFWNTRLWLGEWDGAAWVGSMLYNGGIVVSDVNTLSFAVSSLKAGTRYRYTVCHYDQSNNQSQYTWKEFTTPAPPVLVHDSYRKNSNSALVKASVTSVGGGNVTQFGHVWSTASGPTVALGTKTTFTNPMTAPASFQSEITGLTKKTTYYVRAYATNVSATSYSAEFTINITGEIARLKKGDLLISGEVNELLPPVKSGLMGFYPLKGSTDRADELDGLIGYFPFKGDMLDKLNNYSLSSAAVGTPTNITLDQFHGVNFNKKFDALQITPSLSSTTVGLDFYYTYKGMIDGTIKSHNTIIGRDGGTQHHLLVDPDCDEIGFWNDGWYPSGFKLRVGWEYHIQLFKSGTRHILYMNGELVQDCNVSFDNATYPIKVIGNAYFNPSGNQGSLGIFRDLKIYNKIHILGRGFPAVKMETMPNRTVFNGTSDFVNKGPLNYDYSKGFHFKFRAKFDALQSYSRILDFGNGAPSDTFWIGLNGTQSELVFQILNGTTTTGTIYTGVGTIIVGELADWVLTMDANRTATFYKNGTQVGNKIVLSAFPTNISRANCYIGKSAWGDPFFKGTIDYVHFYDQPYDPTSLRITDLGIQLGDVTTNDIPFHPLADMSHTKWGKTYVTTPRIDSNVHALMEMTSATTDYHWIYYANAAQQRANSIDFTVSAYVKAYGRDWCFLRAEDNNNVSKYAWFNLATGVVGTDETSGKAKISPAGDGWYRVSLTANSGTGTGGFNTWLLGTATGDNIKQFVGDPTKGILFHSPQQENKSYASGYVIGSRSTVSTVNFPIDLPSNFTIFYRFIPDKFWPDLITLGLGKRIFNLYDKNTGKKIWHEDYMDTAPTTTTVPWIGFDEFVAVHWHNLNVQMKAGIDCWFALTKSGSTWTKYYYTANGYLTNSYSNADATLTAFTPSRLELSGTFLYKIRDLAFYNRTLTEAEVKKIGNGTLSMTRDGNIQSKVAEGIIRKDATFFDLKGSTRSNNSIVMPSTELSTVATNDGIWVGTAQTNIYPGTDPWANNGATFTDVTATEPGPVRGAKTWKFVKNASGNQWNGWEGAYGGVFDFTTGDVFTISGWYRCLVGDRAGIDLGCGLFISDWSRAIDYTILSSNLKVIDDNTWRQFWWTVKVNETYNDAISDCPNWGYSTQKGTLYINGLQWSKTAAVAPYAPASLPASKLQYNLNRDIGLDWNGNWSLVYWKKPTATHTGGWDGYSLDSLGSNSNTVGGGYSWFGKTSGVDTISVYNSSAAVTITTSPAAITPNTYFNNWQMVSIVKNGTTVTYKWWGATGVGSVQTATVTMGTVASNYFVTQYGYDFKIGGWDDTYASNVYFKDLGVFKLALSDTELTAMYNTQMKDMKDGSIKLQGQIVERQVL